MRHVPALLLFWREDTQENPWFACLRCKALYRVQERDECKAEERRQAKPARPVDVGAALQDAFNADVLREGDRQPFDYWAKAPMPKREEQER